MYECLKTQTCARYDATRKSSQYSGTLSGRCAYTVADVMIRRPPLCSTVSLCTHCSRCCDGAVHLSITSCPTSPCHTSVVGLMIVTVDSVSRYAGRITHRIQRVFTYFSRHMMYRRKVLTELRVTYENRIHVPCVVSVTKMVTSSWCRASVLRVRHEMTPLSVSRKRLRCS